MLEIRRLTKRYGPVTALDDASFTARRGRLVGFLGPNGAGKTTTMRCVFGLATPDGGDVRWDGVAVDAKARLRFGYMPEQRGLYPRMRVAEQLAYFGQHHGLSGRDARTRSGAWLERFGLADRAKSKLEDLSHGNQQRVQLAAALVHDPELLVLDEPFSGLDPIGIATMSEVLHERAAAGVGVVFSSHQLDLVEEVCEDVVIISRGRVVAEGGIDELKASSGRRHLEVEVAGSAGAWLDGLDGLDQDAILERGGDRVKLLVDEGADLDGLLAAAQAAGEVRRFSYEPPRLSELFMEAVNAPQPAAGGGSRGEPLAGRPARGHARDPGARPEPRLRALAGVHPAPPGGRVRAAPAAPRRPGDPARAGGAGAGRPRDGGPGGRRGLRPGSRHLHRPGPGRRRGRARRTGPSTPHSPSPPTCRRRAS